MAHAKHAFLVLMGALLMSGAAFAQVNRGTITGIVTDQSGGVVPGVAITVANIQTGVTNNVTSNADGAYSVPFLKTGTYSVTAEKTGFKKFIQTNITLPVGETVRLDVPLTVGAATQSVEVTAAAPLLKRDSTEVSTTIDSRMVEDLPLTSFGDQRSPATFMQLAPGVTGRGNSTGGPGGNRTMTTSVSGSMVSSTTLMLNGADIPSSAEFEGDLRALQIPPDAIQEFKLVATNAPAEYGRSGGGVASFEAKSGTNQIHGSAFEYLRNDAINARNFFQPAVTPYKQNEFGVTGGAPIKKDRAFVFGWYDGFRLTQGVSTGLATVPTSEMKAGNFTNYGTYDNSGVWHQTPLYDPVSHTTCGAIICNNIINPSDFSAISNKILPLFPNPTNSDPRAVINNFTASTQNPVHVNQWGLHGDYVINQSNRLSILYARGLNSTPNIGLIPAPLGGGDQPAINKTQQGRLNWSVIIKPNLVNQATAAFNTWGGGIAPVSSWAGSSDWVSFLGIKGVAANYPTQFPQIVIDGQSYNGGGGAGFSNQHDSQFLDTLTWIKGKHTVKMGFQWMREADNERQTGNSAGYFAYWGYQTSSNGSSGFPTSGSGFASFLLGLANEGAVYHYNTPGYARNGYYAGFVQDDYKLTKKLTLNLGLRYDLFTPDVHKYNQKSWMSNTALNPAAGNLPGALQLATSSDPSGVDTHYKDFSPRIGIAYSLNSKTVIRTAYGIYYAQGNANRLDRQTFVLGYNGTVDRLSPDSGVSPGFQWDTNTFPGFTPSQSPSVFNGQGTPFHSAGQLILLDRSDGDSPYNQNWLFNVQRELPGDMTLSVSYVGNRGTHLSSRVTPWDKLPPQYLSLGPLDINGTSALLTSIGNSTVQALPVVQAMAVDPATGDHSPYAGFEAQLGANATLGQALRQYPQFLGWHRYYEGNGFSTYHAMQVKLDKRFSNGLTLLASYAWSKTLTDGGSIFSTFSTQFATTTPWNAGAQKAIGFEDIPQLFSLSYVYDLPVGKGHKFLNRGGVLNQVVGGWKISGIQQYQSGLGMNIETSGIPGGLEDNGWQSPNDLTGQGIPMASAAYAAGNFDPGDPARNSLLNQAAFGPHCTWCFGTLTPTEGVVRTPGYLNEDLSLIKDWQLKERLTLNFHADFFNVFNRVVFGENNGAYSFEPYFGGAGFGVIAGQTNQPRVIQFGLRLNW